MRAEDLSAVNLAKSGQLGDINFFRYFLSIGNLAKTQIPTAIYEAYEFAKELGADQEIYASANNDESVILVTGKNAAGYIINMFFDFSNPSTTPIKQVEIAGTKVIYQFDTASEKAFWSDFLASENDFVFEEAGDKELNFFEKVKASYLENKLVDLGGEI